MLIMQFGDSEEESGASRIPGLLARIKLRIEEGRFD